MTKSLALFVILCVMAPSMYIDARAVHKTSDMSSHQIRDYSKKTGSSHKQTGDLTQSTMSSQAGGDLTKPSGVMSQPDSTEQADEDSTKKNKYSQEESTDSSKSTGSSSQVDSSEQADGDSEKTGTTSESQDQSGYSNKPSGSSSQADPSEQTSEDPTKQGKTSQEESGYSHSSSNQSTSPSDPSPANTTSSGTNRTSTERASTLHATGHYIGKRPSDSWLSANPAEKSNDDVQAAECAHNLRTHSQNFAYFKIDASKANNHGAPYGTCYATSIAPEESELVADETYDVFFWNNLGGEPGVGTGPIRNSETGVAGYEDTEGRHFDGENPDKSP